MNTVHVRGRGSSGSWCSYCARYTGTRIGRKTACEIVRKMTRVFKRRDPHKVGLERGKGYGDLWRELRLEGRESLEGRDRVDAEWEASDVPTKLPGQFF